jgi:radical SAM superfamily enzyme YgiQ (UPF0313 family)
MEKKTLLLIAPKNHVFRGWTLTKGFLYQPLSLGVVAALTPPDWKIKIIDESVRQFKYYEADLVGITSFTSTANRAYEIADMYRSKRIPVVMGGIHASMDTEDALKHVDTVVKGEAESAWSRLISDFEAGRLKNLYVGEFLSLADSPKPRRDLFYPGYYSASVQTTRGCPMDCSFCSVTAFNGKRYRFRPIETVLEELEEEPHRSILFIDDNIIGYSKHSFDRAKELFEAIIRKGIKKEWYSQASINFADDEELMNLARRSGCRGILLGTETEGEEQLKEIDKKYNFRKGGYEKIFKKIRRHGIGVAGTFMFGFENDDAAALKKRMKFINRSNADLIQATILTPLPGTKTYDSMVQRKLMLDQRDEGSWNYFTFYSLVFKHPHFTQKEFYDEMLTVSKSIYNPWRILWRSIKTFFATRSMYITILASAGNYHYRRIIKEAVTLWNKK